MYYIVNSLNFTHFDIILFDILMMYILMIKTHGIKLIVAIIFDTIFDSILDRIFDKIFDTIKYSDFD